MEDKDYKLWLEEAKAELDAYSASREEISKLYEQAIAQANEAYQAGTQQLEEEAVRRKNQAATDTLRAGRNLKQSLAARGLAFSGENAQTDVDLTLALRDQWGEIDSETLAQQQEWSRRHGETVAELQKEHAQHRGDAALKLSQLKAELAKAKKEQEGQKDSGIPGAGGGIPGMNAGSMAGKTAAVLSYMQQAVKDAVKGQMVTPTVSSRELAKQLIKAAGGNGAVSGYSQNQALEALLSKLNSVYLLDPAYRDELMLNLYSMGYNPGYKTEFAQEVQALQEKAVQEFDRFYDRYFDVYHYAGYSLNECDQLANEQAQFLQFVFVYRNSHTVEMFEAVIRELGFGSQLNDFYDEIAKEPDNYVLGSEVKVVTG